MVRVMALAAAGRRLPVEGRYAVRSLVNSIVAKFEHYYLRLRSPTPELA